MIIKNGILLNENFEFIKSDIEIQNNKISLIGNMENIDDVNFIDANNKYVIPGLIDIHIHGSFGYDFCEVNKSDYEKISKYLAINGITSFLLTTITLSEEDLNKVVSRMSSFISSYNNYSYPHGIYLEGPFCSKNKKGAQNEKYIINPDIDMFKNLNNTSNNNIKVVTIAPELSNAIEFIKEVSKDVVVSIAHTDATYIQAMESIECGVSHATHMYNAMTGYSHRDPGVVGAIMDSDITAELICDGIHIHPSVIRTTYKILGEDRLVLMSDSMSAAGMEDGKYNLGGQEVYINDRKATLIDGTIAGSTTNLMECMKIAYKSGIPLEKAIKCATINPAKVIGVDSIVGSLKVGKSADIVILNKDLSIDSVYIKGVKIL